VETTIQYYISEVMQGVSWRFFIVVDIELIECRGTKEPLNKSSLACSESEKRKLRFLFFSQSQSLTVTGFGGTFMCRRSL